MVNVVRDVDVAVLSGLARPHVACGPGLWAWVGGMCGRVVCGWWLLVGFRVVSSVGI